MITYHVRSRSLVDIYNDIKTEKIILAPYFQRNLVWRLTHKIDFIKTILLGYPFPEVFLSRGMINLEDMSSTSSVVDGQQRLTTIREFVDGDFAVEGRRFSDLTPSEKESFLKYEIAVIDLDLASDDTRIIDIFQRLNRTFYALSTIEKLVTEFASSEFMLVAKLLAGELKDEDSVLNVNPENVQNDPNLTSEFVVWANKQKINQFHKFILDSNIFTSYELSRQVHVMFVLNLMATCCEGYYNRNDVAKRFLDEYSEEFGGKDRLVVWMESAAYFINRVKPLPADFWSSKSNSFSLFVEVEKILKVKVIKPDVQIKNALKEFSGNIPGSYRLAAKEGVNNLRERTIRGLAIEQLLQSICQ